ncbi:restriction endonuclease subunit S, partial [Escherichia coli]|nr:restriction endonuclease subunit S [Escherichia coli]
LQSVSTKITDGEHKTPKRETAGKFLLSARNIQDGYIKLADVDYVGDAEFQKLRNRCDPDYGDILISCSGSIGRVCL